MNSAALEVLLTEAKASAAELLDVQRPLLISPGHLHALARSMLNLVDACQGLHRWGLGLLVEAAARARRRAVIPCHAARIRQPRTQARWQPWR